MENQQDSKKKDILPYISKLKAIKTIHPSIKIVIDKYIRVIEEFRGPLRENMDSVVSFRGGIKSELFDESFGDIYPDSSLNKLFPLYDNAQTNFNTRQQRIIETFAEFIIETIETTDKIKETIKEVPSSKQKEMSEADIKAFENIQREEMLLMQKAPNKAEFNTKKNAVKGRAKKEEEIMITDNISRDIFGKKIGDVEWKIGKRKKNM